MGFNLALSLTGSWRSPPSNAVCLRRQQIDGEAERRLFPAIVVFGKKPVRDLALLHLLGIFVLNVGGFLIKIRCPDYLNLMRAANVSSSFNAVVR